MKARISGLLLAALSLSALAAGCATGQPVSAVPAQSRGQTTVELTLIDLAGEIDSVAGRVLRLRRQTLEPGGVVALHSHKDRPSLLHVLQGTIVFHAEGQPDFVMNAGDSNAEGKKTVHWAENRGTVPAVWIVADVFRQP